MSSSKNDAHHNPRWHRQLLRAAVGVWIVVPVVLLVRLVWSDLVPAGHVELALGSSAGSSRSRGPVPESRVRGSLNGGVYQLVAQPVYFDVRQSRPFRTATMVVELDPGSADVIELGIASNQQLDNLTLQPGYHRALEWLARDPAWSVLSHDGVTLYQRGRTFPSVSAFFASPPETQRVMVYLAPADLPFTALSLPPTGPTPEIEYILTGYQPKIPSAMWYLVETTFLLQAAQTATSDLRLVISVPEGNTAIAPRIRKPSLRLDGDRLSIPVLRGWISRWFPPR